MDDDGRGDVELLRASRVGDAGATDALVARYRPRVRAQARGWSLPGADPEDVVGEAFVGLARALAHHDVDGDVPLGAFVHRCVRAALVDALRAATRHKHRLLTEAAPLVDVDPAGTAARPTCRAALAGPTHDPEQRLLAAERLRAVAGGLAHLSSVERDVVRLRAGGYPPAEVARRTGRGPRGVDNAWQRARRRLEPLAAA